MQIVIDIPESIYDAIMDDEMISREQLAVLEKHIYYGTQLPEGHGRLIDADNMKTMKNIQSANFNAVELIRLWIDKQDTIIEADKAESKLDGEAVDIDKAIEHYEGTLETLKGIDLEVDG